MEFHIQTRKTCLFVLVGFENEKAMWVSELNPGLGERHNRAFVSLKKKFLFMLKAMSSGGQEESVISFDNSPLKYLQKQGWAGLEPGAWGCQVGDRDSRLELCGTVGISKKLTQS